MPGNQTVDAYEKKRMAVKILHGSHSLDLFSDILDQDESILWTGRPAFLPFIVRPMRQSILFILICGALTYLLAFVSYREAGTDRDVLLFAIPILVLLCLPMLVALARMASCLWSARGTHYMITTQNVLWRTGVYSPDFTVIPFDKILKLETSESLIEKLLGVGTIEIYSGRYKVIHPRRNGRVIITEKIYVNVPDRLTGITSRDQVARMIKDKTASC